MRVVTVVSFALAVLVNASAADARSNSTGAFGGLGPCGGASAPSQGIQVHVVGRQARASTKVIGHFESDSTGGVTGELIVGSGADRVEVRRFCRIWIGGQRDPDGVVVHVLGLIGDPHLGETYVRLDLRGADGVVRVRSRPVGHGSASPERSMADEELDHGDDHGDDHGGGWSSLTGEGWLNATRVRHRSPAPDPAAPSGPSLRGPLPSTM